MHSEVKCTFPECQPGSLSNVQSTYLFTSAVASTDTAVRKMKTVLPLCIVKREMNLTYQSNVKL